MISAAQLAPSFWSPQVMAAFISGFIALITAAVVATITFRQWKTQNDRLLLDLFDRRFDNFRTIMGAVSARRDDVPASVRFGALLDHLPETSNEAFYRAVAGSHFLFGQDVATALKALDRALTGLDAVRHAPPTPEVDALTEAREALDGATIDYLEACERYMMMGHIAAKGRARRRRTA